MKESTPRIPDNKKNKYSASSLTLMKSPKHIAIEKKHAMVDKILGDLVVEHSFLNSVEKYNNKHSNSKFEANLLLKSTNYQSLSGDNMNTICEEEIAEGYHLENEHSLEYLKFTKAVQMSQSFVLIIDQKGSIEYANPYFQSVSGYTQDELIGKNLQFLISDLASHDEYEQLIKALSAGSSWKGELVNTKKNGDWYIFMAKISPIQINEDNITDFIVVGHDITSFRETEIKLEQAIQEKSILLSELNHRVKDNLAIVSGIMQLQALEEDDNEVKTKLFSSVGRIKALSNVHELLYETNDFSMIDFGENLKKVIATVAEIFEDDDVKLTVNMDIEPVILNIDQAHACALIMNEVVTNSYKEVFLLTDKIPVLDVKLVTYGKKVLIELKDNICSSPEVYSKTKKIFSSELIETLVNQINGKYNYLRDDYGSLFSLIFEK